MRILSILCFSVQEFQHELYHSMIANIPDKVTNTLMQIILFKAKLAFLILNP